MVHVMILRCHFSFESLSLHTNAPHPDSEKVVVYDPIAEKVSSGPRPPHVEGLLFIS